MALKIANINNLPFQMGLEKPEEWNVQFGDEDLNPVILKSISG